MTSLKVLLLATNNDKKRGELQDLVQGLFEVRTLRQMQLDDVDFVEDKATFAENARVKIDAISKALAHRKRENEVYAILADDSGLIVDVLKGPGVRSARFASDHGAGAGDAANNRLLLQKLADVPAKERSAHYACAICLKIVEKNKCLEAFGAAHGHIALSAKGTGGFGYDPYFIPVHQKGRHMAELSSSEKAEISHRGKATRAVLTLLMAEPEFKENTPQS